MINIINIYIFLDLDIYIYNIYLSIYWHIQKALPGACNVYYAICPFYNPQNSLMEKHGISLVDLLHKGGGRGIADGGHRVAGVATAVAQRWGMFQRGKVGYPWESTRDILGGGFKYFLFLTRSLGR